MKLLDFESQFRDKFSLAQNLIWENIRRPEQKSKQNILVAFNWNDIQTKRDFRGKCRLVMAKIPRKGREKL